MRKELALLFLNQYQYSLSSINNHSRSDMKFVTWDYFSILYHLHVHDCIDHNYDTYVFIVYIEKLLNTHLLIVTNKYWMFKILYKKTSKDQFYAILEINIVGHA